MPGLFALFRLVAGVPDAPPTAEPALFLGETHIIGDDEPLLLTDFVDPEPRSVAAGR